MESEFGTYPLEVLDGWLKATDVKADAEDIGGSDIPSSLAGSGEVEIRLEGIEHSTGEYKSMTVRGSSAAITRKGSARFVESLSHLQDL